MTKSERLQLAELQQRAARLKARIEREDELDPEIDLGPYRLRDAYGYDIWVSGLPLAGIAEALDCYEHELALPPGTDIGVSWADFGAWMK
jgi:hypothetical protein